MFYTLLDKQDQIIYQIFSCLQEKNPCSLDEIAFLLEKSIPSLQRSIRLWQEEPQNQSIGVGFYLKNGDVKGIYTEETAHFFLSTLLQRSINFQFLNKVLVNPYCSATTLQRSMYIGVTTFQRRMRQVQTFLDSYELELSFKHLPALKGEEIQIRWLIWQLSLVIDPPARSHIIYLFARYEKVYQFRNSQGFSLKKPYQPLTSKFFTPSFQLNERGLLFIWRQLLGIEPFWVEDHLHDTVAFALRAHTLLNESIIELVQPKIHRLHSLCALFSGSIQTNPNVLVANEVQLLKKSFCRLLPEYGQLLQRHPELPILYQQMFNHYRMQEDIFLVSEE